MRALDVGIGLLTLAPGRMGGSETNVRGLLDRLPAVAGDTSDQLYTVFTSAAAAPSLERFASPRMRVTAIGEYSPGEGSAARLGSMLRARYLGRRLARAVGEEAPGEGFDVVHFPLTVSIPKLDCPTVVTIYDLQHELMPEFFSVPERAYRRLFYASAISDASLLVTISEFTKATIVERHEIEPERVIVSLLAVDRELFAPEPRAEDESLLAALELPERFVVYPANLWPHKNHERLLEGLALVADEELELVLTGQQYGRWPALAGRAAELGIAARVHHVGYVERKLLPAIYRAATGLVFPSLFEGFGLPPLEALSCGCPVAASRAGALPEMLARNAIWFDPTDPAAIAEAIATLVAGGRERGAPDPEFWRPFTWSEAARIHRAAYDRAAASAAA